MLKTVTGRIIPRKRDPTRLTSAPLPRKFAQRSYPPTRTFTSTSQNVAQPETLDKHDEDVQRILREYGVDPDEVGDAKQEEKKKRKRGEKKVEDFEAWKEWDGMLDRKDEVRSGILARKGNDDEGETRRDGLPAKAGSSGSTSTTSSVLASTTSETPNPTPLFIRPLPSTSTPNGSASTSTAHPTDRFQSRLNDHIKTLRTEADALRKTLSVRTEVLRSRASERAKVLEQNARLQFGLLGGRVNELTGYNEVERLKREVTEREDDISRLRTIAREAKLAYDEAVSTRTESQREVNSLLERKHAWTDSDVIKFTSLVRADHTSNTSVQTTKTALVQAEAEVEKAFDALMKSILHRYHEEQVWSDKIRSVSTYGSLIVLVVNLVVFLGAIAVVEPWKRKRLVKGLEDRVKGMMETVEGKVEHEMLAVKEMLHGVHAALAAISTGDESRLGEALSMTAASSFEPIEVSTKVPLAISQATTSPGTSSLVPRSIVYSLSEQVAKISPRSSDYMLQVDPRSIDAAVVGTAGIVLGAACTGLIAWLR